MVLHTIGLPFLDTPLAPAGEQNAPAVTPGCACAAAGAPTGAGAGLAGALSGVPEAGVERFEVGWDEGANETGMVLGVAGDAANCAGGLLAVDGLPVGVVMLVTAGVVVVEPVDAGPQPVAAELRTVATPMIRAALSRLPRPRRELAAPIKVLMWRPLSRTAHCRTARSLRFGNGATHLRENSGRSSMTPTPLVGVVLNVRAAALDRLSDPRGAVRAHAPIDMLTSLEGAYKSPIRGRTQGTVCPTVPASIIAAQIETESGWNLRAISNKGAQGPSQFMPGTWAAYRRDEDSNGTASPFDIVDAVMAQARYDCAVTKTIETVPGDRLDLTLAGYNAGPGAVLAYAGIPPYGETRAYVTKIRTLAATKYAAAGGPS